MSLVLWDLRRGRRKGNSATDFHSFPVPQFFPIGAKCAARAPLGSSGRTDGRTNERTDERQNDAEHSRGRGRTRRRRVAAVNKSIFGGGAFLRFPCFVRPTATVNPFWRPLRCSVPTPLLRFVSCGIYIIRWGLEAREGRRRETSNLGQSERASVFATTLLSLLLGVAVEKLHFIVTS